MKRQFNVHGKAAKLFSILLIAGTLTTSAQAYPDGNEGNDPVIQSVSKAGDNIFQVSWDNTTGDKFGVIVRNKNGDILFNEIYADQKFDKKFKLPINENDEVTITFRTLKGKTISSYKIQNNLKTIEVVDIKKID